MEQSSDRLAAVLADRYRIERELGAGGMAVVFLARDLRHERNVALKVLRPDLAAVIGADRFLREIRLTANLQHPHILPLHDSGEVNGTVFYVMPYVEGESLRDRLNRERQLPVQDSVRIAREVASALDYAHRHGVIHRDIKPENILLHDGQALVADFGIALAANTVGSTRITETGMSIGTPQYMSPEQAMGEREITGRSDVYALGVVTYEMLCGEPPFTGATAQAIVARVLTETPRPLTLQRHTVPPNVEEAVLTALEKLPADRFATAGEFAQALSGTAGRRVRVAPGLPRAPGRRLAGLAVAALAAVAGAFWLGTRVTSAPKVAVLGAATPVTWDAGLEVHPAISPDGRAVAYAAGALPTRLRIYVRPVGGGRAVPLTDDSTQGQSQPRWSPDGTRILFVSQGGVFSAPAFGGAAKQEIPGRPETPVVTAAWSPDGSRLAYAAGDTLFLREPDGRNRGLAALEEPALCAWSPDGSRIACATGNVEYARAAELFGNLSPSVIAIVEVRDGAISQATDQRSSNQSPVWANDRQLYFVSNRHGPRDIYVVDVRGSGGAAGPVTRLTAGLGAHTISLSADGSRLAYAAFSATANVWALPIPSRPPVSAYTATQVTHGNQLIEGITASRDGRWLYYDSNLSGNADLYRVPAGGGPPERLTTDPSDDFAPSPSPDGREVAFHSWRTGNRDVFVLPLDGRPLQQVTATPGHEIVPRWSPDGLSLAYFEFTPDSAARGSVWVSRRTAAGTWAAPARRIEWGSWPTWSPDGRQIAYTHGFRSPTLFIQAADSGAERQIYDARISGGPQLEEIAWSADARSIFFKSHAETGESSIWEIPVTGGPPRLLVRFDDLARPSARLRMGAGPAHLYFGVEEQRSDVVVVDLERQ